MDKIIKTSKTIQAILKVLFWLIAAISTASFITIAAVLAFQGDEITFDGISVIIGNYSLFLNQEYTLQQFIPVLCMTLVNVVLWGVLSCYVIRILLTIFQPMSQGEPFHAAISDALKKLANVVLVFGIVGILLQIATNLIFYNAFDIPSLFNSDKVTSCSLSLTSDGSFLLWFFLLRLFSHIFRYGEALQQLSDETL